MKLMSMGQLGILLLAMGAIALSDGWGVHSEGAVAGHPSLEVAGAWELTSLTDGMLDELLAVSRECDFFCRDCGPELEDHEIIIAVENNSSAFHLETCNPKTCQESGHLCPGALAWSEAMGNELWAMLQDASGVRHLRDSGLRVEFNSDRGHMQLLGCRDTILASVPVAVVE